MLLEVKNKNDLEGDYTESRDCPIARALRRLFPNTYISVGPDDVLIGSRNYKFGRSGNGFGDKHVYDQILNKKPFQIRILGLRKPRKKR